MNFNTNRQNRGLQQFLPPVFIPCSSTSPALRAVSAWSSSSPPPLMLALLFSLFSLCSFFFSSACVDLFPLLRSPRGTNFAAWFGGGLWWVSQLCPAQGSPKQIPPLPKPCPFHPVQSLSGAFHGDTEECLWEQPGLKNPINSDLLINSKPMIDRDRPEGCVGPE